jgi:hypothetical protein
VNVTSGIGRRLAPRSPDQRESASSRRRSRSTRAPLSRHQRRSPRRLLRSTRCATLRSANARSVDWKRAWGLVQTTFDDASDAARPITRRDRCYA